MYCDKSVEKINKMFDSVASGYDLMNNLMSLFTHNLIKYLSVKELNIRKRSTVLDLCCGTGDFSRIISNLHKDVEVIGLDNSLNMLKIAKNKYSDKVFIYGDCINLPFNDEFDYITIGFGLRNIENRKLALEQIYKSLKKGGQFLHLDFGEHNFLNKIFDNLVPLIAYILRKDVNSYKYLIQSKNNYPEPEELIKEFSSVGFKFVKRKDFLFKTISVQIMEK